MDGEAGEAGAGPGASVSPAKLATDLPLWPEAPFRDRIAARFEIRMGDFAGRKLAVVWDPKHQIQASGYLNDQGTWAEADLQNVMANLCGATFINKFGFDATLRVLEAKKINPRALSPEARELLKQYDEIYDWERASALSASQAPSPAVLRASTTPAQASEAP